MSFTCAVHAKHLATRALLHKHLAHKRHRLPNTNALACPSCRLGFAEVNMLEAHNTVCHGRAGASCCSGCERAFDDAEKLARHMRKRKRKCGLADAVGVWDAAMAGDGAPEKKRKRGKKEAAEQAPEPDLMAVDEDVDDGAGL